MRDTGWRIHFGAGLLGASNLTEENTLPSPVLSAASVSGEMRAVFYWWRQRGARTKQGKERGKIVIRAEQASH